MLERTCESIDRLPEPLPCQSFPLSTGNLHPLLFLRRFTIQPDRNKGYKPAHHAPQAGNPYPAPRNSPTSWPLIVRKVSYRHLSLLLDVRQEGTLVVDFEGEDPVLVWQFEGCAEDGAIGCCADGVEWKAVEGREHAEFKLEAVCGGNDER